jgi:hypothetical protein
MSKLCAYRGALATATLSLALGAQAEVIEITIDPGSQTSPTATSCTGFDTGFAASDCSYNDTGVIPNTPVPVAGWIGPRTRDGFFPVGEAQTFTNTGIPANPVGVALSGSLLIDTQGTADCADDTLAGSVQMAPFTRNLTGNNVRQVENYPNGITQVIEESPFATGVANALGGCDYTLGSQGVPNLLTGNYGDFPGDAPGGVQPGANPALAWTGPGNVELTRFDTTTTPIGGTASPANIGARALAVIGAGYECLNNALPCASGAVADVSGGFSFAWNPIAASDRPTQKASWNNILGNISTDAGGNITGAFLYLVHDDIEISTFANTRTTYFAYTAELSGTCSDNCPATGPLPPVATNDTATVNQDSSVVINVLANDLNLTDPVTVTIATPPTSGSAVVNGSPGAAAGISVTYTPNAAFFGEDSFVYTVSDENGNSNGTVSITINQVGANDDTASTRLNTPVVIDVLANDVGFDDPVTVTVVVPPNQGGTAVVVDAGGNEVVDGTGAQGDLRIRFTPNAALGTPTYTETFTYQVEGAGGIVGPVQLNGITTYTITSGAWTSTQTWNNNANGDLGFFVYDNGEDAGCPLLGGNPFCAFTFNTDEGVAQSQPIIISGTYSGTLEVDSATGLVVGGSLVVTGSIADQVVVGNNSWWLRVWNDLSIDFATGQSTVSSTSCFRTSLAPANCFPAVSAAQPAAFNLLAGFEGPAGTGAPYNAATDGPDDAGSARLTATFDASTGVLALFKEGRNAAQPAGSDLGYNFTLQVEEGNGGGGGAGPVDSAVVTVTVNNALPVATNTTVNVPAASVRAVNPNTLGQQVNVATLAGNSLGDAPATVSVGAVTNGTASVSGNVVTVTPNATFFVGSVTAEYTITDADGETATGIITVTLPDVAPTLNDGSASVQAGQSATVALSFVGGNGSVAQHTLAVTTQATSGSCALDGASVVYTAGTEAGTFSCVVTLTDGDGDADTGTFTFTVTAPPAPTDPGIRLPGGGSSMDLLGLALLAGLPLLRRRRRLS